MDEQKETKIFVKLYVDAIHSGLAADMGAERWHTLCALAVYMDENGECYPSMESIAARLGIKRESASRRISRLLKYRWNGRPLVTVRRRREPGPGTWANNVYTIAPEAQLQFGNKERLSG
ncbi:helix-turn-helix domain-containing protein [Brevibacillus panacihumi]|uniref:helix-turn-helix domain-containing protein n=1 Tax=Brevibacillus panacihumi TaxID=497735 RepID=UPI003D251E75